MSLSHHAVPLSAPGLLRHDWTREQVRALLDSVPAYFSQAAITPDRRAAVLAFGLSGREGDFDPAGVTAPFGATGDLLVAPFARWDAVWYLNIAHDGYRGDASRAAFFPLYPLIARGIVGGVLVSAVAAAWGVDTIPGNGKVVWADLALPAA